MIPGDYPAPEEPADLRSEVLNEAPGARRIALGVEYCGRYYQGWQCQDGVPTVQGKLMQALSRVADTPLRVHGSGRTDAGVHATAQVAHFDTRVRRACRDWMLGANACLPEDIRVLWVREVPSDFHARHSALRRRYRYLVHNALSRSALYTGLLSWEPRTLVLEDMRAAARHLEGHHDFTSFRAASCGARNPCRTLYELRVWTVGELLIVEVEADAFLHHMVRNIAGLLLEIGLGRRPPEWAAEVLALRERRRAARTAAAAGLYLVHLRYPRRFRLPSTVARPAWPAPDPPVPGMAGGV